MFTLEHVCPFNYGVILGIYVPFQGGINPYTLKNKHSDGGWKMTGYVKFRSATPLKFHMEPENGGLEDDFPFQLGDSYVPC